MTMTITITITNYDHDYEHERENAALNHQPSTINLERSRTGSGSDAATHDRRQP